MASTGVSPSGRVQHKGLPLVAFGGCTLEPVQAHSWLHSWLDILFFPGSYSEE